MLKSDSFAIYELKGGSAVGEKTVQIIMNLSIPNSGLNVGQKQMQVTQNNIANANTEGYAKQKLDTSVSHTSGEGVQREIGSGVIADGVTRVKDDLLIEQHRNQISEVKFYEELESSLSQIESIMDEGGGTSPSELMAGFFNSWEELSKNPDQSAYRRGVINSAQEMSVKFNGLNDGLKGVLSDAENAVSIQLDGVNRHLSNLADINEKLSREGSSQANELFDKRDKELDELSEYIDIQADINEEGVAEIKSGNKILVSASDYKEVEARSSNDGNTRLFVNDGEYKVDSGSLAVNNHLANNEIPSIREEINDVVGTIIENVNDLHQDGFDLNGENGEEFFTGVDMSSISVNENIENDTSKLAASSSETAVGNSDIARGIADFNTQEIMNNGESDVREYYRGIVTDIGMGIDNARGNKETFESVRQNLESQKESVQGVNIDEELANLMQFQNYYASNAQSLQRMNDSFQTLLSII